MARKSSPATVVVATPETQELVNALVESALPLAASPLAQMAEQLVAQPVAVQSVAPPPLVFLRGKQPIVKVALTGNPYRVGVATTADWWNRQLAVHAAQPDGIATIAQLNANGVPNHFIGYVIRRGYVKAAA